MKDNSIENALKLCDEVYMIVEMGADFDIPDEFKDEIPDESTVCDWEGGVLNEIN